MKRVLGIVGDYDPEKETHVFTNEAISHCCEADGYSLEVSWIPTTEIKEDRLDACDGLWIVTGSPYKSLEGALQAITYARENKIPCLGTCSGFQHIIIEYAKNVLGLQNVGHAEYDVAKDHWVISDLIIRGSSTRCSEPGAPSSSF